MPVLLKAPRLRGRTAVARRAARPSGDKKVIAMRLAGGAVLVWGLISLLGLLVTHVFNSGPVHHADLGVDVWFAAHRTPLWNTITFVGTTMAQTWTALGVTVVVALLLRWRLGRWHESWVLVTVMAGELLIFLAVTLTIHRHRPPVHRLDVAPETSSFPSGHTAAAVALYGCIAVLVLWIYGRRPVTRAAVALLCCIPVYVGLSRLYRGMHYPSDVLAGALLGSLWLLVVISTLLPNRGAANSGQNRGARTRGGINRAGAVRRR